MAVYWRQTYRLGAMLRAGLISMIYRQTTRLKASDFKSKTAITLMGTDVERIVTSSKSIHEIWASPLEVAFGLYLLERQVGVACLVPAVISICMFPLVYCISGIVHTEFTQCVCSPRFLFLNCRIKLKGAGLNELRSE